MLTRRAVIRGGLAAGMVAALPTRLGALVAPARGRVVVVRQGDRAKAVAACLDAFDFKVCEGRDVAVKANFNSGDPFPASTSTETPAREIARLLSDQLSRGSVAEVIGSTS